MRRSLHILAVAKSTFHKAHKAGRAPTLSPTGRRILNADKDTIVLRGRHILL
jgi:hypothetical protein